MANIRKVENKSGTSYRITVFSGRDANGKQLRHYATWVPPSDMPPSKIEKEVQRQAVLFEEQINTGFAVDNRQTFAEYAEYVLGLKQSAGIKHKTIETYRFLLLRINPAIGHKKIVDIKPAHLNLLYANLAEQGIRKDGGYAIAKANIGALLKERKLSNNKFAALSGVSATTIGIAIKGERISKKIADLIASGLNVKTDSLFNIYVNDEPLCSKTIAEYHRLISTILRQAEKEMIVQFNVASRTSPPKVKQKEAETCQPAEVEAIFKALEQEPLKWRTFTHLLLMTGCRRGEICGLTWDSIDWDGRQIKVDSELLYTAKKGIYEDTTKTYNTRYIKLPEETMSVLHEYRAWYVEQQMKSGDRWEQSGYLFVKKDGGPMHPDSITCWLAKFSKRHNLPHLHPHLFRHTHASMLYYGGVDSVTISKRLGHARVSTTSDTYSHLIKQADEEAADCIADALLRKPNIG